MLPGGGHLRQSLRLLRGIDNREADECRLDPRVRKWSLGVTEALGGSPRVAFMAWDGVPWGSCLQAIIEQEGTR